MVSPSWSFITFKMLPAGWKPIRLLHSPSLDIPENGTSLYSLTKKKKKEKIEVEGVVCSITVI